MPVAADSQIGLSVFSEDSFSPNLVDPTFIVGSSFNITIVASNLPTIDQNSGGVSGFDVSLTYNASIIRVEKAGFDAPFCPSSDGCIFDLPRNDTVTTVSSIGTPAGTLREAMVALGPTHRAVLPTVVGQPAYLFRVTFDVVGKGLAPIKIQGSSQLLGFTAGCGNLLQFTTTDGSFDNRAPFRISATPPTPVAPGSSVTMQVNVSLVNSAGNGNVNLELSGIMPIPSGMAPEFTYLFNPMSGTLNGPAGMYSFLSSLQITADPQTPTGSYPLTIAGVIPPPASNYFQYNYNFTLIVSTGQTPAYSYASTISSFGAVHQATRMAQHDAAQDLLAAFTTSSSIVVGGNVTFTAVAVWCSSTYTLRWSFGDGGSGTGNPVIHRYSASGAYTATLNVTDSGGKSYYSSQAVTVSSSPAPPPPGINIGLLSSLILLALFIMATVALFVRRRRNRRS